MEMVLLDDKGPHGEASGQRDNSIPILSRSACNVIVRLSCDQPFPNILIIDERVWRRNEKGDMQGLVNVDEFHQDLTICE
jgi:hypothetical protein